jgi:nucleoid DNA-binding protein
MEELIKAVVAKTGLSESHARLAVETVLSFLKAKLPAPLASGLGSLFDKK